MKHNPPATNKQIKKQKQAFRESTSLRKTGEKKEKKKTFLRKIHAVLMFREENKVSFEPL